MLGWLSVAALVVVVILAWVLHRRFGVDRIDALVEKRRATSRMVSCAEFVDGNRHLAVSLSLTDSTLRYESSDMEASLDLHWVREVEYDTELATGGMPQTGKVLRLRSRSQTFEFVLPDDVVARWHMMLPPRRMPEPAGDAGAPTAPPPLVVGAT